MRHCGTSRKVAVSIPDGIIEIFHLLNPSDRSKALGSTQPLTEMSARVISWGVKAADARDDNRTTFMCRLSRNPGSLKLLEPWGTFPGL